MKTFFIILALIYASSTDLHAQNLTDYVNPFLGTTTLWDKADLHYERHGKGRKITDITSGGKKIKGYLVNDADFRAGKTLVVKTK